MTIVEIKSSIKRLENFFKDNVNASQAINKILTTTNSAGEILEYLKQVEKVNTSPYIQNYIEGVKKELYKFEKVEKEIKQAEYKLDSLINEIKDELIKRNINVEGIELRKLTYDRNDLQKQQDYLKELELRYKYLDETRQSIHKEKEVGQRFQEGFQEGEKTAENIKKIDDEVEKNIKELVNPDSQTVVNYLNFFYSNRKSDSNVSIKIEKEPGGSRRTLSVTNVGTSVSEKEPKAIFYFNDSEYFDKEIMPRIIGVYKNENVEQASLYENNSYQEISESGDSLEINNMNRQTIQEKSALERKRPLQRVRKQSPYGISSTFFMILTLLILITGILTIILLRRWIHWHT